MADSAIYMASHHIFHRINQSFHNFQQSVALPLVCDVLGRDKRKCIQLTPSPDLDQHSLQRSTLGRHCASLEAFAICKVYVEFVVIDSSMDAKSFIEGNSPVERYIDI